MIRTIERRLACGAVAGFAVGDAGEVPADDLELVGGLLHEVLHGVESDGAELSLSLIEGASHPIE